MKFGSNNSVLRFLDHEVDHANITWLPNSKEVNIAFALGLFKFRDEIKNNVTYWTKPFSSAYFSAKKSIEDAMAKDKVAASGHYAGAIVTNTICECVTFYSFDAEDLSGGGIKVKNGFAAFFQNHILHALYLSQGEKDKGFSYESSGMLKGGFDISTLMIGIVRMELFKSVCELQVKNLPPNSKTELFHCKYLNKTKYNIKILDSTYFTNLVKTEGFGVRGHLRLQPCGEGMKGRKVIWIDPYQKNGYTRRAGKIIEQGGQT